MDAQAGALIVSSVSAGIGLTTLALVIRNELRTRRLQAPILWGFHQFGKRSDGMVLAELVQYGRQPTRVSHYQLVGFDVKQEPEHRLRAHVKAEDTLPLLLTDVEDRAWMLISHFPRDDRRWLYFEYVPLRPESAAFQDEQVAAWNSLAIERRRWKQRALRVWQARVPGRPVVRQVGPTGFPWARIRADRSVESGDELEAQFEKIYALANEQTPEGAIPAF